MPVAAKWYQLGTQLKLQAYILREIKANNQNDSRACLSDALERWHRLNRKASWEDIVNALKKMDEDRLAEIIQKEYCRKHYICHNETQYIICGIIFVRKVFF